MSGVLYLYGFVPSEVPPMPDGFTGIDERPVEIVDVGPFAAAVSELDADVYDEASIAARLKDLAWVGRHGAWHETVVTWFSDHAVIVPARLLTVFSSREAMSAEASERRRTIEDLLERFRNDREWDLKVSYDVDGLTEHLGVYSEEAADEEARIRAAPPGRRYLLERSRDERARGQAAQVARRLAGEVLDRLRTLANDTAEVELPQLRGGARVVLNAALLVSPDRAEELQRIASEERERLEAHGVEVSLTGPWAPYRFMPEPVDG